MLKKRTLLTLLLINFMQINHRSRVLVVTELITHCIWGAVYSIVFRHTLKEEIITGRNEVVAKVMFLHVSVILLTGGGGFRPGRTPPARENPPRPGRPPPPASRVQNTVYERPVRILLECILVQL